jgi:hypothetical protein
VEDIGEVNGDGASLPTTSDFGLSLSRCASYSVVDMDSHHHLCVSDLHTHIFDIKKREKFCIWFWD